VSNCGGPTAAGGGGGGASASFIFGADAGQLNTATTIDAGGVPQIAITYTPTVPPSADLRVSISGPQKLKRGTKASFKISATNDGPDEASAVVVTDRVPVGMKPLAVSSSKVSGGCSLPHGPGTVRCTLSSLSVDAGTVMKVKVKATRSGKRTQKAKVSSNTADPNAANNSSKLTTRVTKP